MGTPKFIALTEDGLKTRVNAEHISRYWPSSGGAKVEASGLVTWYAEPPEQIDAMLGVAADPVRSAAPDLLKACQIALKTPGMILGREVMERAVAAATGTGEAR